MTSLKSIKVEGGLPRDERRETIRALRKCPLEKTVLIGTACPIGNTWGHRGLDLVDVPFYRNLEVLEAEDKEAIWTMAAREPTLPRDLSFEPVYGWSGHPPFLHTMAAYHANTITELKLFGFRGSAVLFAETPITTPLFSGLKYFHKLEQLSLSFWLPTHFEGAARDAEVIAYWLNFRHPSSTALVRVTDEEPEGWERELKTKFAPAALAWEITSMIGPRLSEQARKRKGGVKVRASFLMGEEPAIFDMKIAIGTGAVGSSICLEFDGPRDETDPIREREQLEKRRWF